MIQAHVEYVVPSGAVSHMLYPVSMLRHVGVWPPNSSIHSLIFQIAVKTSKGLYESDWDANLMFNFLFIIIVNIWFGPSR